MKIIGTSNFDNESVSDFLVCENVNEHWGQRIVKLINEREGENSSYFYKLVPDDHELYEFEP